MARQVQLRRGTTAQQDAFTGAVGELTVDTDRGDLRLGDSSTAGGLRIARAGRQTIGLPLQAAITRTSNGATALSEEATTNKNMITGFRFAQSVDSFVQARAPINAAYDDGAMTAQFLFRAPVVTTGTARFRIRAVCLRDSNALDQPFGTSGLVDTTVSGTAGNARITAETTAFTPALVVAGATCVIQFEIYRAGSETEDNAAGDIDLLDAWIYYNVTKLVDD